jgi:glutamate racemase
VADGADRPIGVFDSGVGGLSVLRALRAELPHEQFVYVADSGHAPYGERDDSYVIERSHAIVDYLVANHQIKAMVVACNTATAAAIAGLRLAYRGIPLVGIEPALKPAAASSQTGSIGVIATRSTLQSEKFHALLDSLHGKATFVLQPCDGLVRAIERDDAIQIGAICKEYTGAMGTFGANPGDMDILVLGCTHYPFVASELRQCVGDQVMFLEGGAPVARQTRRLLEAAGQLEPLRAAGTEQRQPAFFTTGDAASLRNAVSRWLEMDATVNTLAV